VCGVTGKVFALLFHYIPFRIICSYTLMQGKITKHAWEENGVYGGDIEIIFFYLYYVSQYLSEG
jgi:hypothetical protein